MLQSMPPYGSEHICECKVNMSHSDAKIRWSSTYAFVCCSEYDCVCTLLQSLVLAHACERFVEKHLGSFSKTFFSWEKMLLTFYWSSIHCCSLPYSAESCRFLPFFLFLWVLLFLQAQSGDSCNYSWGKWWSIELNIKWLMNKHPGSPNTLQ